MNCITRRWWATCLRCRIKLHLAILFPTQKEVDKGQPASMEARETTTKKATRAKRTSEEKADNTPPKKKVLNMNAIAIELEVLKPTISTREPILQIIRTTGIPNQTLVNLQAPQEATTLTLTPAQVQAQRALQSPRKGKRKENQRRRRPKKPSRRQIRLTNRGRSSKRNCKKWSILISKRLLKVKGWPEKWE